MPDWCDKHWVRARETGSGLLASLLLMKKFINDPVVMQECGYDPKTGAKGDADKLNEVKDRLGPLCCWVGEAEFDKIIEETRRAAEMVRERQSYNNHK